MKQKEQTNCCHILNYVNGLSVTLCLERYTLQKSCGDIGFLCGTGGSETNPLIVCAQHLQEAICVIQLHTAKCVMKAPICSLLLQLSSSIVHDGSNSFVGSPCHLVFSEYIPVNVQCRQYNFTIATGDVTQTANT